jgi:site-specific DNA recombinase
LRVNAAEAEQVREIFALFVELRSLQATLAELERRGGSTKSWRKRNGERRTGSPFTRQTLAHLLRNVTYVGLVRHNGEVFAGEQAALVERAMFERVQRILAEGAGAAPAADGALPAALDGLLYCESCGGPMVAVQRSTRAGRGRYYTCASTQACGCPTRGLAAEKLERAVWEHLGERPPEGSETARPCVIDRISYQAATDRVCIRLRGRSQERDGDGEGRA